jgi:N,N'-diacetyllegionaminate synthase
VRDARDNWARVVASTDATYDHEIARAAEILRRGTFALLHCVTIYPTPISELHLRRMNWLRRFSTEVGLSDHTLVKETGLWASKIGLAIGAEWIERHFTVLDPPETKDGAGSITPTLLRELREFARRPRKERMEIVSREYPSWPDALGFQQRPLSLEEILNHDYYRGRFASLMDGRHVYNWEDVDLNRYMQEGVAGRNTLPIPECYS